jgi:hypothetical protein
MSVYAGINVNKKGSLSVAKNANNLYAANLSALMSGMGKQLLGAFASEVLMEAILHGTKHDSSRAAANWDLSLSGSGMHTGLIPHDYGTNPIGKKGDEGAYKYITLEYKRMVYGINDYGDFFTPKEGGMLHTALGIGKSGSAPRVELFNPIMSPNQERRQGWGEDRGTGATYAFNAFFGGQPIQMLEVNAQSRIGNAFIPWMIARINRQLLAGAGSGRMPPF